MTWLGKLANFFPGFILILVSVDICAFILNPSIIYGIFLLAILYILPLTVFRIHGFFFRPSEGLSEITNSKKHCSWWVGHQIQWIYIAFPELEAVLRAFPGLYSAWLRLWGARVGKGVYWTPRVEIIDRDLMQIGDGVVFGHRATCVSHVVNQADGNLFLYVRPIIIGDHALIGAGSSIGPGCIIDKKARLKALSVLKIDERHPQKLS